MCLRNFTTTGPLVVVIEGITFSLSKDKRQLAVFTISATLCRANSDNDKISTPTANAKFTEFSNRSATQDIWRNVYLFNFIEI